jgi:hypothetical protein
VHNVVRAKGEEAITNLKVWCDESFSMRSRCINAALEK